MKRPRNWRPLRKITHDDFQPQRIEIVRETMAFYKIDEAAARKMLDDQHLAADYWINDIYQVQVVMCGPDKAIMHINIRRRDGAVDLRDWRHFQQIKNEIAGEEREGFELYPAESRKVDTSNKFHIFVLPEGASFDWIGWHARDVQYDENRDVPGLRQRPL